ncbi:MAG: DUF4129 domain-containing protein [Alphaproteobacteria bacterium]|nr:DUF4129 domain-containing protein [Alphaproteobacteria bacterium]MBL6936958.1 DUF4129 domain-containing protein [Alphaproteobacteria bacterium]MBL7097727.1 DUF4129 domain-containing protein [Alphaproteobacteria bacterium]
MAASSLQPADDRAFGQAHAALLKHSDIQFAFPGFKLPPIPDWLKWLGKLLEGHGTAVTWFLYVCAAAFILTIAIALIRQYWHLLRWRKTDTARKEWAPVEAWRPTAAQARQLLTDADALAAQGHYGEAVHLLLLRSIEDIETHRPRLLRRAQTSREIAGLNELPESARPAFRGIARAVERARFAGEAIGAAEFARCRKDYESFAFAPAWRMAA